MAKLEGLLQEETSQLARLVRDENRFIQYYKQAIETSPLQVYASALVFSPVYSIVRNLFKQEEPEWITTNPPVENNWNACRQTLEGHNGSVASVAFSPDNRWLASASRDKTIKVWDPASGACTQTLKVGRVIYNLVVDPTGPHLYTDIGSIELNHDLDPLLPAITQHYPEPSRLGYGLRPDGMWITWKAENVLWLPPEYRPACSAVAGSAVAIGCPSGRVVVLGFSADGPVMPVA